jgi:hypothetical protein
MENPIDDRSWHESSYSGNGGGDRAEVAECPGAVFVRDTTNRDGGTLGFSAAAWAAFLGAVKRG